MPSKDGPLPSAFYIDSLITMLHRAWVRLRIMGRTRLDGRGRARRTSSLNALPRTDPVLDLLGRHDRAPPPFVLDLKPHQGLVALERTDTTITRGHERVSTGPSTQLLSAPCA